MTRRARRSPDVKLRTLYDNEMLYDALQCARHPDISSSPVTFSFKPKHGKYYKILRNYCSMAEYLSDLTTQKFYHHIFKSTSR